MNWCLVLHSDRSIYRQKLDNTHTYLVEYSPLGQNSYSQNCNLECYMQDLTRSYYSDRCHIQHILRFLKNKVRMLLTVASCATYKSTGRIYKTEEKPDHDNENSTQFTPACFMNCVYKLGQTMRYLSSV